MEYVQGTVHLRVPGVRLTRIIATIGPASADIGTISEMIRAGMDIARLNLSHGTLQEHQDMIARIRLAARESAKQVAIMIDIPGPKLRVRSLPEKEITLSKNDQVILSANPAEGEIGISPAVYIPRVYEGDIILIADGAVLLTIIEAGDIIRAKVESGGTIRTGAGVVFPGTKTGYSLYQ